jgi:hypothetical protein
MNLKCKLDLIVEPFDQKDCVGSGEGKAANLCKVFSGFVFLDDEKMIKFGWFRLNGSA